MAIINGLFNSSSPPANLTKPSFANAITRIGPNGYATLFALTGMMKEQVATQVKHGYFSKTMMFPSMVVAGTQAAGITNLAVADTSNVIAGQVYQNGTTGEQFIVRQVTDTTHVQVTRGAGTTVAAQQTDADNLWLVGNAFEEGSTRPVAQALLAVENDNYCQIFRNTWSVSETMRATLMAAGDTNVAESLQDCMQFHGRDIETSLFFGQKLTSTQNGSPMYKMEGVIANTSINAPANVNAAGATTNYTQLETLLDPVFDTRTDVSATNERIAFVGGSALRVINNIGRYNGTYQLIDGQTSFGLRFRTLKMTRGDIQLIEHPLFNTNTQWSKMAVVVDLPTFDLAYLRKTEEKQFNMDKDANDNGIDAVGGTVTTQLTALFKNPLANAVVTGLTAAAKDAPLF